MSERNDLREKKLRGSGGYAFANITDEEQKKGNLGGPELFLAGVGRLNEDRFSKYYCNKCEKEYEGSPAISYENPNEELGEDVILIEKGEYKCSSCNNVIAQYRKFNTPATQTNVNATNTSKQIGPSEDNRHDQPSSSSLASQQQISPASSNISMSNTSPKTHTFETKGGGFTSIQSLVGMPAYNSEAMLIGRVVEIGLRRLQGRNMQISIKIANENNEGNNNSSGNNQPIEVSWDNISKIGDIILVGRTEVIPTTNSETVAAVTNRSGNKCSSCGYQNQDDAIFCEECGNKLV
jgi:sporulation protein YlmC with PRC-barrel domain/DNA-directed RNA polymerase subunit RPC12/RpoP